MSDIRPRFKDVEIKGQRYRIGKLPALVGTWVAQVYGVHTANKQSFTEDEWNRIQTHLLGVCGMYKVVNSITNDVQPWPVMPLPGKLLPELQEDTGTILELTMTALGFNMESFDVDASAPAVTGSSQDMSQLSASK